MITLTEITKHVQADDDGAVHGGVPITLANLEGFRQQNYNIIVLGRNIIVLASRLPMGPPIPVTEVTQTRSVLIVDRDLGFVFWLGRALDDAGYQALPAKGIGDATELLGHMNLEIDLLIVSPSMPGARA